MKKRKNDLAVVFLQTLIIALIGAVLSGSVQFLFPLLMKFLKGDYVFWRFLLGGVYGWLLGVLNFLVMGLTLIYITATISDRKEGQRKGQMLYTARMGVLLLFLVGGCFLPCFHYLPIIFSFLLTWAGINVYALISRAREASSRPAGGAPGDAEPSTEETGPEPSDEPAEAEAPSENDGEETK